MSQAPLKIGLVVGSVRTGRFADTVTRWALTQLEQRAELQVEVIDLSAPEIAEELKLSLDPLEVTPGRQTLAQRIAELEGYVLITPEYNHGYPAALKLAIDYVYEGWRAKPVAFVSYGGIGGGLRSVEQLRQVFAEMHAVTLRDVVSFHNAPERFGESGEPHDAEAVNKAATALVDQLLWWGLTLREGRENRPYTV